MNIEYHQHNVDFFNKMKSDNYMFMDDYIGSKQYGVVIKAIYSAIKKECGSEICNAVKNDGLNKIHLHVDPKYVEKLQKTIRADINEYIIKWTNDVGKKIGLKNDYLIQDLLMVRIHYPYFDERTQNRVLESRKSYSNSKTYNYHKNIQSYAMAHGPHRDSWYGHSFGSFNLWWSIAGTNELNSMSMYPELNNQEAKICNRSHYLDENVKLPKPFQFSLKDGELFLFYPEMLHSTTLNTSDETRIALTTRIAVERPSYALVQSGTPFQHWYLSSRIDSGNMKRVNIPAEGNLIDPKFPEENNTNVVDINIKLSSGLNKICESKTLEDGRIITINDAINIVKSGESLYGFSNICPHLGIKINDGFHDGDNIYCPGHGVKYDYKTCKSSSCKFELKKYNVIEENGQIYLEIGSK